MEVKPLLHEHHLCVDEYKNQEACCGKCAMQIDGPAFTCENCKFWVHFSCAVSQLPKQISHLLHPQHNLTIYNHDDFSLSHFVCDKCVCLSRGPRYYCHKCEFRLDVTCASPTDDLNPRKQINSFMGTYKRVHHVGHEHELALFNYRKVKKYEYCCSLCEKPLFGMSYGCLECSNEFFLHESCFTKTPKTTLKHPFHTSHPLTLHFYRYVSKPDNLTDALLNLLSLLSCKVCKQRVRSSFYDCQTCIFGLHFFCAKYQPTLKHECHQHNLTYIQINRPNPLDMEGNKILFLCNKCGLDCNTGEEKSTFYRCVECDFNVHFKCAPIPTTSMHRYHIHSLYLTNSFVEESSGEYYCDICEKERNPKHHVYLCKECKYVAHIECALDKFIDSNHGWTFDLEASKASVRESMENEETEEQRARESPTNLEITHSDHIHRLKFHKAIQKNFLGNSICRACDLETNAQAGYACEYCSYYMHKACATLPEEMLQHPLHPQHPLILRTRYLLSGPYICDACRDIVFLGFIYICFQCDFKLDVKCATLKTPESKDQILKRRASKTKLLHFSHSHMLAYMNFWPTPSPYCKARYYCQACMMKITGPTYGCFDCGYYLHEPCLQKLPLEIQHSFHPQHPLHPFIIESGTRCLACRTEIGFFCYSCSDCDIYLHFACLDYLRRTLKSKSHNHNLYYFGADKESLFGYSTSYECKKCKSGFPDKKFYRCLECDFNFHLECIAIPPTSKSSHHIHPFTLMSSFSEDDLGEYYCDICEEERNPNHHVYYCKQCSGLFVAHIECVLNSAGREIETGGTLQLWIQDSVRKISELLKGGTKYVRSGRGIKM